jgi:uracil phosphoribosyltransferase
MVMLCFTVCWLLLQVVPVLRAGLVLLEQAQTVLPACETYHVGYVRDEKTLQVTNCCQDSQCSTGQRSSKSDMLARNAASEAAAV